MFPMEKHSVLDNFAQGINGDENARANLNLHNLLTENDTTSNQINGQKNLGPLLTNRDNNVRIPRNIYNNKNHQANNKYDPKRDNAAPSVRLEPSI
ncbi:hypothetical protein WN48_09709 [Eufriesea mexicana]|uniref:Uncharacterized protein n=1 Tax=Eufriesea mexicana TaxID=516756 RepID=A0A310S9P7_9HYME|nr:hypothetical protein WN48_09709 [Eufriesea mexicana]